VTTVCSRTSVVANLAAQEQGSYRLTVTNGSEGSATFDVTYGTVGLQGPQGPIGLTGATGAMGPQGPCGPAGANGTNGADDAAGPQGPQGPLGSQGVPGTNGANGAGMNWTGPWSATTSYNVGDAVSYYGAVPGTKATLFGDQTSGPASIKPAACRAVSDTAIIGPETPPPAPEAKNSTIPQPPDELSGRPLIVNGCPPLGTATLVITPSSGNAQWNLVAQAGVGAVGAAGPAGAVGLQGRMGLTGAQGPAGTNGTDGSQGP